MHDDIPALGFPLAGDSSLRVRLGTHLITTEPVYWLPEDTRFPAAANLAVVGGEKTGNTQMLFSAAIQLLRQKEQAGEPLGLLLVDGLEDYSDSRGNFLELTEARILRLHKLPFHPLGLSGLEQKPQLHTQTAMVFADTLARSYGLSPLEKSTLVQSVIAAYASVGITSDPLTWNRKAPSLEDVYEAYRARPQGQRSETVVHILDNLATMELFDPDAAGETLLLEQLQGTVVLDMSGYPEALKYFVLRILLETVWAQISGRQRTLERKLRHMILIDHADRLLTSGSSGLESLLTRGWEYGVGLMLAAHSMEVFQGDGFDCRKWIRAWVLHNAADLQKADLEFLLQMDIPDSELARLYQTSTQLPKLHSLIFLGTEDPVLAEDLPFFEIAGDDRQSYLIPERAEPEPEPLAGMPLLDFDNLDTLAAPEEDFIGLMGIFDDL